MTMVNKYVDMIKKGLLLEICDFYWCNVTYTIDGTYEFDNHEERWYTDNIDDALTSWLDTMIATDEESEDPIWGDAIKFINEILRNNQHILLVSIIQYSMIKQITYDKGVDIMLRMTSLDSMANFDNTLDRFEELSRHGYSFEKLLDKLEEEDTFDDWTYWE